jgi:hypothetical protein
MSFGCNKANFQPSDDALLGKQEAFVTKEDTPADFNIQVKEPYISFKLLGPSGHEVKTNLGKVSGFDEKTGKFHFVPDPDAFGSDSVDVAIDFESGDTVHYSQPIEILPVNDPPSAESVQLQVELNQNFEITATTFHSKDIDTENLNVFIRNADGAATTEPKYNERSLLTLKGSTPVGTNLFHYLPVALGTQTHEFIVSDGEFEVVVEATFNTQLPLKDFKPALAVRDTACLFCHSSVKGNIVTDFGANENQEVKFYNTADRNTNTVAGGYWLGNWGHANQISLATSYIEGEVFVPRRNLSQKVRDYASGNFLEGRDSTLEELFPEYTTSQDNVYVDTTPYVDPTYLVSLADYFDAALSFRTQGYLEFINGPYANRPKRPGIDPTNISVREVNSVKIGAPSESEILELRNHF